MQKQHYTQAPEHSQGMKSNAPVHTHRSPLRLFLITIAAIFLAEVVAMIVVYFIEPLPYHLTTLVDAGIMIVLIFPVLYYFSFYPLIRQMQKSRQAEESLLQTRQLQERFFDSIDTLIAYMDRDFNFIRVNEAYARSIGQTPDYFTGRNHFELYPHAENQSIFQMVVETGEGVWIHEKAFEYPDQPERGITYWNWSLQPVKNSEDRVEGLVLSLVDVTKRKRAEEQLRLAYDDLELRVQDRTEKLRIVNAELEEEIGVRRQTEEALRKSELRLKRAQEIAHLGSWELDLANNRLTWSDEVYRIFGLQPQEFRPSYEAFLETVHPDDRAAVDEAYSRSIRDGRDGYEIEHRLIKRSSGEIRVVHEKCEHFRNEDGQIIRSTGMVHDITERKQAENKLRYQATLLSNVNDAIMASDAEFRITAWNSAAESLYGWKAEEVIGRNGLEIVRTEWTEKDPDEMRRAIAEAGGWRGEATQMRKDGTQFPVEISSIVLRDDSGQITGYISVNRDITERKKAEDSLRRSETLLLQTGKMAKVGGWELDLQTMTPYWSPETYRIHELDPSLRPNLQDAINFYAPEARAIIREAVQQAIEEGRPYDLELPFVTAKGNLRWIRTIGQPDFRDGKCVRLFGTFQDITERKQADELLQKVYEGLELRVQERTEELAAANRELMKEITERKEIERQLRIQTTAMEVAANGIMITDRYGTIQWANSALTRISGYDTGDLIGHPTKIFKSGKQDAAYYRQMWDTILCGEVWQGEMTNRRKDGSLYVEEQTITPVRDDQGEITQFIAIKQDITERKQAEKEISERNQKEKILTETIHTMQLDIARDLHDTIGQNISFLRMKLDYLAEKKVRRKADLQHELLSMARAADESYDLMRGTLAVLQSPNATDLLRLFTHYAKQIEERAVFKINLSSQGEPRFMSARRMRQLFYIFREILNNIEKHARASQVTIEMVWAQDFLNLVVYDNGSGFDPEKVQYGSHYGLRFMKERVELLNGSLSIHSAPGSGTNMILEVPYD